MTISSVSYRSNVILEEVDPPLRLVPGIEGLSFKGIGSPFQGCAFVGAWMATRGRAAGSQAWLLTADDGGAVLPLEIVRRGSLRIGRFPGQTHANANGWCICPGVSPPRLSRARILAAATAAGVRIDALDLRRIADPSWIGPEFSVTHAFEQRFGVSLDGGLEAVLERGNGKRKRKKFRLQQRHFASGGGYRFVDLPIADRTAALEVFLTQKQQKFQTLDIPNPFAKPGMREFLSTLFRDPRTDTRLYAIESGGVFKAILGGIMEGQTFWGMFSSYAEDADAAASPGELMLWHVVERLSAEGVATLDLGPGTERYKRAWSDRVVPQADAKLALTALGSLYVAGARLGLAAGDAVKGNAGMRSLVQRVRRRLRFG